MSRPADRARTGPIHPELVALAIGMIAMFPREAWAYIDPGTGSMAWQTALTLLLGMGVAIRSVRHRLWAWFTRKRLPDTAAEKENGGSID